jgi:hypothetical protein
MWAYGRVLIIRIRFKRAYFHKSHLLAECRMLGKHFRVLQMARSEEEYGFAAWIANVPVKRICKIVK